MAAVVEFCIIKKHGLTPFVAKFKYRGPISCFQVMDLLAPAPWTSINLFLPQVLLHLSSTLPALQPQRTILTTTTWWHTSASWMISAEMEHILHQSGERCKKSSQDSTFKISGDPKFIYTSWTFFKIQTPQKLTKHLKHYAWIFHHE